MISVACLYMHPFPLDGGPQILGTPLKYYWANYRLSFDFHFFTFRLNMTIKVVSILWKLLAYIKYSQMIWSKPVHPDCNQPQNYHQQQLLCPHCSEQHHTGLGRPLHCTKLALTEGSILVPRKQVCPCPGVVPSTWLWMWVCWWGVKGEGHSKLWNWQAETNFRIKRRGRAKRNGKKNKRINPH